MLISKEPKNHIYLTENDKQKIFDKYYTIIMALFAYMGLILYLIARAKSFENSFFLKEVIISTNFKVIFGLFGALFCMIGGAIIDTIMKHKITGKIFSFSFLPYMKYGHSRQTIPLFIAFLIVLFCELTIFIIGVK